MSSRVLLDRRALLAGGVVSVFSVGDANARPGAVRASAFVLPAAPPGTIIISQRQRRLYLMQYDGTAISYPVAIGRAGRAWSGWARIDGKHVFPAWSPPAEVKRDNPRLPAVIPGGAPNNPMGARALTLDRREIAIHGTTAAMRASIGTAASYGCIRMFNEHIIDLFNRVSVGTRVLSVL